MASSPLVPGRYGACAKNTVVQIQQGSICRRLSDHVGGSGSGSAVSGGEHFCSMATSLPPMGAALRRLPSFFHFTNRLFIWRYEADMIDLEG